MILAAAVAAGATGACVPPMEASHVLTGPPLPATPEDAPIGVYLNQTPALPYREVAQIRLRAIGDAANVDDVLATATREARAVGADAIIVDARRHYRSVPVHVGCDRRLYVDPDWRLNARVTAIRFVRPGTAQPEAPPTGPRPLPDPCE
jgi:hypothetical protein